MTTLRDEAAKYAAMALADSNREWYQRVVDALDAVAMAKTRLEDFADKANAGQAHYDARELKRRIWAAFADFDRATS